MTTPFPPLPLFFPCLPFLFCLLIWFVLYSFPHCLNPFSSPALTLSLALGCHATSPYHLFLLSLLSCSFPLWTFSYVFMDHIAVICAISPDQSGNTKFSPIYVPKRVNWIIATFSFISWSSSLFSCLCRALQLIFLHHCTPFLPLLLAVSFSWVNRAGLSTFFDVREPSHNLHHLPLRSQGHYFWTLPQRPLRGDQRDMPQWE